VWASRPGINNAAYHLHLRTPEQVRVPRRNKSRVGRVATDGAGYIERDDTLAAKHWLHNCIQLHQGQLSLNMRGNKAEEEGKWGNGKFCRTELTGAGQKKDAENKTHRQLRIPNWMTNETGGRQPGGEKVESAAFQRDQPIFPREIAMRAGIGGARVHLAKNLLKKDLTRGRHFEA